LHGIGLMASVFNSFFLVQFANPRALTW
jgi:hypothetical protein